MTAPTTPTDRRPRSGPRTLAQGLGWFSLALGAAELLMPHAIARALGMPGRETLLRTYALREIATGVALLASRRGNPAPAMWARVAGDALDLGTLGAYGTHRNPRHGTVRTAMVAVAGIAAADVLTAQALAREHERREQERNAPDYSGRSGWPRPAEQMRGIAANDSDRPADLRTPAPMRPYPIH